MPTTFLDLSEHEVELVAEALKGTTWLAIFSRVSKACRDAASASVEEDEASLSRLNVCDVVRSAELVAWALDEGCPRSQGRLRLCTAAARGGHLGTLKWLRGNICPWNEDSCSWAAKGGHLETLAWLRANGCPWTREVCSWAAEGGHLEVLKWARCQRLRVG